MTERNAHEHEIAPPTAPPPMTHDPELALPQVDPDLATCLQCGYSLRGLDQNGVCPECGLAVADSLKGNLLMFANDEYLRKLLVGAICTLSGVAAYFAVVVLDIFVAFMLISGAGLPDPVYLGLIGTGFPLAKLGLYMLVISGLWMFSTADPAIVGADRSARARRLIRICSVITCTLFATIIMLPFIIGQSNNVIAILDVYPFIALANALALIVLFFAVQSYFIWMAMRLPGEDIARRARMQRWLIPILIFLPLIGRLAGPLFAVLWVITLLISLVLWWNNLNRLRNALKQIRHARMAT